MCNLLYHKWLCLAVTGAKVDAGLPQSLLMRFLPRLPQGSGCDGGGGPAQVGER